MNSVEKNAANEIESKVRTYMAKHGVDYEMAYRKVIQANRELVRRYNDHYGETVDVKKLGADTLTTAQREMAGLLADPEKTQTLAGYVIDHLAKRKLTNVGGLANPVEAYRRALVEVRKENPSLDRAAEDGFIAATDFELLAMLVPSIAGEVERGNYSREDSTRCECGENRALCRGKKLAAKRGVHEDHVAAFAACIRDAQRYGDQLDAIRCYFK